MQLINIFFFLAILLAFQANAIRTQWNIVKALQGSFPTFGHKPTPSPSPESNKLIHSQGSGSSGSLGYLGSSPATAQFASFVGVPVSIVSRQSGYFLDVQVTGRLPDAATIQYLWNNPTVQQILNSTNIKSKLNATNLQELGIELNQLLNGTPLIQLPGLQALLNGTNVNQLLSELQQQLNIYQLLNGYINSTQLIVKQQSCSPSQKWKIVQDINGSYHIVSSVLTGVSITINPLAVQNGQVADGTGVELFVDSALPSQRFNFEQSTGNFWRIVSAQLSGKSGSNTKKLVLDLQGGNLTEGTSVVASHDKSGDSNGNQFDQDWLIVRRSCGQSSSTPPTPPTQGGGQSPPPQGFSPPTSVSSPVNQYSPPTAYSSPTGPPVYVGQSPVVGYSSPSETPYQASSPVAVASPPIYSPPTYYGAPSQSSDNGGASTGESSDIYSSPTDVYSQPTYGGSTGLEGGSSASDESSCSDQSSSVYQTSTGGYQQSSPGDIYSAPTYVGASSDNQGSESSTGGYQQSSPGDIYSAPTYVGASSDNQGSESSTGGYQQSSPGDIYSTPTYVGASSPIVIGESPYQPSNDQGQESSPIAEYSSATQASSGSESGPGAPYSAPTYVGASSPVVIVESPYQPSDDQGQESSPIAGYSPPVDVSSSDTDVYSSPASVVSSTGNGYPAYPGQVIIPQQPTKYPQTNQN